MYVVSTPSPAPSHANKPLEDRAQKLKADKKDASAEIEAYKAEKDAELSRYKEEVRSYFKYLLESSVLMMI